MSTAPKPYIVKRNGRWCLFANRSDAYHWPFPMIEARTVRGLSECLSCSGWFKERITEPAAEPVKPQKRRRSSTV